ncbi:MAG: hypothetical protein ACTSRU_20935 [Candidatus Hodarchaeales archaeon]
MLGWIKNIIKDKNLKISDLSFIIFGIIILVSIVVVKVSNHLEIIKDDSIAEEMVEDIIEEKTTGEKNLL